MGREASRRALLAGLAVSPALAPASLAVAAANDVDRLFTEWVRVTGIINGWHGANLPQATYERPTGLEAEILASPPCSMRLGATALIELTYVIVGWDETPAEAAAKCIADRSAGWFSLQTLACLRPQLTGFVAHCAADILDNLDRPMRYAAIHPTAPGREA